MRVSINHDEAYKIILEAIEEAKSITTTQTPQADLIEDVILGTHLTYRYILVTGFLAKATNELANPLALQANAEIDGAYDARSLCHSVIVGRVEEKYLQGRLGASNEPFLNKPARYTTHSIANPARKGYDKEIQQKLFNLLCIASNKKLAYKMLVDAMYFTLQRNNRVITPPTGQSFDFTSFINKILSKGIDGETCAITASLALSILAEKNQWQVITHPVNQAGTSSKEILDIDIYKEGNPIISIEVKDKDFGFSDVNHAIHKARNSGVNNVIFIKGLKSMFVDSSEEFAVEAAGKMGMLLTFINVKNFALTCYALSGGLEIDSITAHLNVILKNIRAKDATVNHVSSSLQQI